METIPDHPPVVYGAVEDALFGAEVRRTYRLVSRGNSVPTLLRVEVSGADVRLAYDQPLDAASIPPAGAFRVVLQPGYRSVEVTRVAVRGSDVALALARAAARGETVALTYEVPAAGAIRDADGLAAVGLTWVPAVARAG